MYQTSSQERKMSKVEKRAIHSIEDCLAYFHSVKIQCTILSDTRFPSWSTFTVFFGSDTDVLTFQRKLRENIVQLEKHIEQGSDCMAGFRALKAQFKEFMAMDFKVFKTSRDYESQSRLWRQNISSMEVEYFIDQIVSRLNYLEYELNER